MPATSPHSGALKKRGKSPGEDGVVGIRCRSSWSTMVEERFAARKNRDRGRRAHPRRRCCAIRLRWMSFVPEKITPPTLSRRSRSGPSSADKAGGAEEANRVEAVLDKALRHMELGHRRPDRRILAL